MNRKNLTIKLKALNIAIAMLCMGLLFFVSCGEEDNKSGGGIKHDPTQPLAVTSITPDSGRIAEMVILDGSNFGTDTSNIRVYFNAKQATVLGSTGTRMLVLAPRLPGDTCIVRVEVGDQKATYPDLFRYKISATATTLVGGHATGSSTYITGALKEAQFGIIYLGIDKDDVLYATSDSEVYPEAKLLKIDLKEKTVVEIASEKHGMSPRFQITGHPETGVIMMGGEGSGNRDNFLFCDPVDGWAPKNHYIKQWVTNDFSIPSNTDGSGNEANPATHYHCLYSKTDGKYYTRYNSGHLVKIDPLSWIAEVVYMTPKGVAFGMAFHPKRPSELWITYGSEYDCNICSLDITDPEWTYKKHTESGIGFRDGPIAQAQFGGIRQANFDPDGNLFIGDSDNQCIRKLDTERMVVETVLGIPGLQGFQNGKKEDATFRDPHGIVTNSEGIIYVGDHHNYCIRRIAIE